MMATRDEYTIAWNGEPSMSGQPHRQSMGSFATKEDAERAVSLVPSFQRGKKPGQRIERRQVSDWEIAD